MKKFLPILGIILLIVFISGGNYLTNWSTAELVGSNLVSLSELIGGIWLVYNGIKELRNKKDTKD